MAITGTWAVPGLFFNWPIASSFCEPRDDRVRTPQTALRKDGQVHPVQKIAAGGELKVVLGEKGLTERIMNLL